MGPVPPHPFLETFVSRSPHGPPPFLRGAFRHSTLQIIGHSDDLKFAGPSRSVGALREHEMH